MANNLLESEFFTIEMKEVNSQSGKTWDDRGTKADQNIAFWKVDTSPGYYSLGHFATLFHDIDPSRGQKAPAGITLKPKPGYEYLLQEPVRFEKIWDDAGSGGDYGDCNIFRMICPDGYVALGDVISSNDPPDIGSVRCIKKTAVNAKGETVSLVAGADYLNLAEQGETALKSFWSDAGSGADKDVSIWLTKASGSASVKNQVYISPGTFKASPNHDNFPADKVYALVLNFPEKDILADVEMSDKKVKLKGAYLPTEEELKASEVTQEYTLPFFAVTDPDYKNPLDQFRASPTYTVKRTSRFKAIDSFEPSSTETKQYTVMTGVSKETNYNNEVGVTLGLAVEVGGEAGIAVGKTSVKVTASVEASYSHSWGGATSNYEEDTFMYPQTVTGGCFGALFQVISSYSIYRQDGTTLGAPVVVKTNEFYTDQWCPKSETPASDAKAEDAKADTAKVTNPNIITFTIEAPPGKVIILDGRLEIRDGQITSTPTVTTLPATVISAPVTVSIPANASPPGQSMSLGANTPAMVVNNKLSRSYTKEAWIKLPDGNTGGNNIISGGVGGTHAFWINNRKVVSGHNDNGWEIVKCDDAVGLGWEHYAVTYDADTLEMKLYKNGKMVNSAQNVQPYTGGNLVQIGRFTTINGDANIFTGEMAEVRIWNSPRSEADIAANMNVAMPKATAGLIAKYPIG